ncbi:MAG: hypothetical protein N2C14_06780, partial [Planctomycetales bacterium]
NQSSVPTTVAPPSTTARPVESLPTQASFTGESTTAQAETVLGQLLIWRLENGVAVELVSAIRVTSIKGILSSGIFDNLPPGEYRIDFADEDLTTTLYEGPVPFPAGGVSGLQAKLEQLTKDPLAGVRDLPVGETRGPGGDASGGTEESPIPGLDFEQPKRIPAGPAQPGDSSGLESPSLGDPSLIDEEPLAEFDAESTRDSWDSWDSFQGSAAASLAAGALAGWIASQPSSVATASRQRWDEEIDRFMEDYDE